MPVMNKAQLVEALAERGDVSKDEARRVLDSLKEVIVESVSDGTEVKIPGFVSFAPYTSPARVMKHPLTGEDTTVEERKSIKVRVMGTLKSAITNKSK